MLKENNMHSDYYGKVLFQLTFACSKLTTETLEKGVNYT